MTDACQFDETDHNYLHRRWEAEGWSYWYEHSAQGHMLLLSDDTTHNAAVDGISTVSYQRHGGATEEDSIDEWSPARRVVASAVTVGGFDFKQPQPVQAGLPTLNRQGQVQPVENYEYAGAYPFADLESAQLMARVRMEEIEALGKHFDGGGNCRRVQPGCWFELTGHFDDDEDQDQNGFLIIEVIHEASNNYLQLGETHESSGGYKNYVQCQRRKIAWRPGRGLNSIETRITSPQTAIVVGPNGPDSIHTDEYGRIRVQFHWDRVGATDERSSAWLRVAGSWSGSELGAAAVPRVGSEVIVQWLGGSPDRYRYAL